MQAGPATGAAVRAVLDRLAEVYVTRDTAVLRALFASDPDVVMFSPGADRFVGASSIVAKAERDWARSDAASLTFSWVVISTAGSVAWAATEATFTVTVSGRDTTMPARITFVLEQRGEAWLIVLVHYSFAPVPQD